MTGRVTAAGPLSWMGVIEMAAIGPVPHCGLPSWTGSVVEGSEVQTARTMAMGLFGATL